MNRVLILLIFSIGSGCVNSETRFERVDQGQPVVLPMKLDSVSGLREGETVKARIVFRDGAETAEIRITVKLGPPPEFTSGTYQTSMGGSSDRHDVECRSLSFLGGQNAMPSVGGIFLLKDSQQRTIYRVTMPATPIQRQTNELIP